MKKFILICLCIFMPYSSMALSLINDTETERLLQTLITPLAESANVPKNRLKIHIINSDDFNAFVRGGEDVYVYTGLLMEIKNPSALQAVVAHELGHVLGGHTIQLADKLQAEMQRALLIQALGIGLMVAGGEPSAGLGVMAGGTGVAKQSVLAFSRDEERMADDMGFDLMLRSNQDVNGFETVFQQMSDMSSCIESKINPNMINHPLTNERLQNIRAKISALSKNKQNKQTKYDKQYELVRAKLTGYLKTPNNILLLYPYSDKSDYALYARAIGNMRSGNLSVAKTGVGTLLGRDKNNPYYYELLGDIEYQYGHYDDSISAYEHALQLSNNAPQIQTALALVLIERNKPNDTERALELCKHSLLQEPMALTYWTLARVYDTDARSLWAMAEYYNLKNDKPMAKKYAKQAIKKLQSDTSEYIKSNDILNSK